MFLLFCRYLVQKLVNLLLKKGKNGVIYSGGLSIDNDEKRWFTPNDMFIEILDKESIKPNKQLITTARLSHVTL